MYPQLLLVLNVVDKILLGNCVTPTHYQPKGNNKGKDSEIQ